MAAESYIVLRDLSRRHGGLGIHREDEDILGRPKFNSDAEPSIERMDLTPRDVEQLTRDRTVLEIARNVPVALIDHVASPTGQHEPVDTSAGASWGLIATGVTSSELSGSGVVVGVIDSGINKKHPAFHGVPIKVKNLTSEAGDPIGHGTHCAGIIFGQDVNGFRIGVARGIEKALVVKAVDRSREDFMDKVLEGIEWCHEEGAHVISMSLSVNLPKLISEEADRRPLPEAVDLWLGYYRSLLRTLEYLAEIYVKTEIRGHGSLLVAAVGNQSRRPDLIISGGLPSQADGIIGVGAVQSMGPPHDQLSVPWFSNREPLVCAPGVDIISAGPGNKLVAASGTSTAVPHVAGIAALCWELLANVPRDKTNMVKSKLVTTVNMSRLAHGTDVRDVGMGVVVAPKR
jgi:subtilisin family serine protease